MRFVQIVYMYTYEAWLKSIDTDSVNTKVLYLEGWEVNPLQSRLRQHVHSCSTVPTIAGSTFKLSFCNHQQLLHCIVFICLHIVKCLVFQCFLCL